MKREVLALGPFLTSLEQRLDELSAEQLRRVLVEHGARLPADQRAGFLHVFDTPATATGHHDPDLPDDAESFVADIAKGTYVEGYGFVIDYGDYRAFGDDSWTVEMDDLLDRAGAAFLAGDATLAREAYRVLLGVFGPDDAESGFPGAGTPEELIRSDVGEAKARYLRSVWESEPLATREAALVEAADALGYVGDHPTLAALDSTRREPLPDLDRVLPGLIAARREIHPDGLRFGAQARRLLAEATELHRGVDGLADLARTPGPRRAEAYRDWVGGSGQGDLKLDNARLGSAGPRDWDARFACGFQVARKSRHRERRAWWRWPATSCVDISLGRCPDTAILGCSRPTPHDRGHS